MGVDFLDSFAYPYFVRLDWGDGRFMRYDPGISRTPFPYQNIMFSGRRTGHSRVASCFTLG